jgi:hypothetical protein
MSNKKDHLYGVLGSGDINPKIVIDGLLDANEDASTFLIHARRKPQGAVTSVYDFLADNEVPFIAYHRIDDNPPKALLEMAQGVQVNDDPAKSIITSLKRSGGTLLLLWDDENPEASEKFAVMAADAGVPIKDLSDGLAPIVVEGSETVVEDDKEEDLPIAPKPTKEAEEPLSAFSREELMNMNIGVLRRQAKAIGIENIGRIPKEEIVDMVLGVKEINLEPVVASDVHVPQEPQAMVIYMENGSYMTVQVPLKEIKKLLS